MSAATRPWHRRREYGLRPEDELLLYVIHGVLHLVGFDDQSPESARADALCRTTYLEQFGVSSVGSGPEDDSAKEVWPGGNQSDVAYDVLREVNCRG